MSNKRMEKAVREMVFRVDYVARNWKQIVHLALGTGHFGVSNRFWSPDGSLFEKRGIRRIFGLSERIRMMQARAFMGFIPLKDAIRIFPGYARKHGYVD